VSFDALLKKYSVYVLLALVGAIAYFQAAGTMQLVGAALTLSGSRKAALLPSAAAVAATPSAIPKDAEPILARNAFDSVTGPLNKKPLDEVTDKPPTLDLSDPLGAVACEGIRAAIITESHDPNWSIAALAGTGETSPKMRRIGDEVNGKQVVYIGFNPREQSPSVWLALGATLCQVLLFPRAAPPVPPAAEGAAAPGAEPQAPRGPAKIPRRYCGQDQENQRHRVSCGSRSGGQGSENQAELMRSARIIPETKDGQVVGVRLLAFGQTRCSDR